MYIYICILCPCIYIYIGFVGIYIFFCNMYMYIYIIDSLYVCIIQLRVFRTYSFVCWLPSHNTISGRVHGPHGPTGTSFDRRWLAMIPDQARERQPEGKAIGPADVLVLNLARRRCQNQNTQVLARLVHSYQRGDCMEGITYTHTHIYINEWINKSTYKSINQWI